MKIDNLKIEKKITLNGETMYQVRNIDTGEVLFISKTLDTAINYAEGKVGWAK
jgi:hypothetical protein